MNSYLVVNVHGNILLVNAAVFSDTGIIFSFAKSWLFARGKLCQLVV